MKIFASPLLLFLWISIFTIVINAEEKDQGQHGKTITGDGGISTKERENQGGVAVVDDEDGDNFDYRNRSPDRRNNRNNTLDKKRPFNRENDGDLDEPEGSFPSKDRKHKHWKKKKHHSCKKHGKHHRKHHHHHHRHHHHHHHHGDKHHRHGKPHHRKDSHSNEDTDDRRNRQGHGKHRHWGTSTHQPGGPEQNPDDHNPDAN